MNCVECSIQGCYWILDSISKYCSAHLPQPGTDFVPPNRSPYCPLVTTTTAATTNSTTTTTSAPTTTVNPSGGGGRGGYSIWVWGVVAAFGLALVSAGMNLILKLHIYIF